MKKVLSSMLALTLCAGAFGFPVNVASADDETPALPATAAGTFKMAEGASVCVSDPGIRFRVEIADDVVETAKAADDFGFLVFPQEYLATAKANVEAGTAANYHDKFDGELVDDQVPADKAGTYGLYDYAEVSMTDEDLEAAVYTYAEDGKQYVNVIYQDEVVENRDVELTALAWYKNGETYTYAELNDSFSRSVAYVVQQEYIAGNYSRSGIMTGFPWLAGDTFEIRSGADMTELSAAVAAGETFENINFALTKTIAVGSKYVPVADNFAGTFNYDGNRLLMVDNENKPFAAVETEGEETLNVKSVATRSNSITKTEGYENISSKFIDASSVEFKFGKLGNMGAISYKNNQTFTNADTSTETVACVWFDAKGASGNVTAYLSCTSDWIYGRQSVDLIAAKELFTSIKFRMYVEFVDENGDYNPDLVWKKNYNIASASESLLSLSGYNDSASAATCFPMSQWFEFTVEIDDLMGITGVTASNYTTLGALADGSAITAEYQAVNGDVFLSKIYTRTRSNPGGVKFYFADCVFGQ